MKLTSKKLKGFTLIELIIVCALFMMILVGAMAILKPVSELYQSSVEYENSRAASDIVSTYIEGSLKYADRLWTYSNMNDTIIAGDPNSRVYDRDKEVDGFSQAYFDRSPTQNIYVLDIMNSEEGRLYLSTYEYSAGTLVKKTENIEVVSPGVYEQYGFNIEFSGSTQSLTTTCNVFKRNSDGSIEENGVDVVSSMMLLNIYDEAAGAKNISVFNASGDVTNFATSYVAARGSDATNEDIHLIFTLPDDSFYVKALVTTAEATAAPFLPNAPAVTSVTTATQPIDTADPGSPVETTTVTTTTPRQTTTFNFNTTSKPAVTTASPYAGRPLSYRLTPSYTWVSSIWRNVWGYRITANNPYRWSQSYRVKIVFDDEYAIASQWNTLAADFDGKVLTVDLAAWQSLNIEIYSPDGNRSTPNIVSCTYEPLGKLFSIEDFIRYGLGLRDDYYDYY